MSGEEIEIKLRVPDEIFSDLDRRFDAVARRATQAFGNAARSNAGTLGGSGGGATGGGGSPFGTAAASLFQGAGQGFLNTTGGAAGSPAVLADNAAKGAERAGLGLAKAGLGAVGAVIGGATLGPAGAIAGAAAGSAFGDLVEAQYNRVTAAMEIPRDRTIGDLASFYDELGQAGVKTSRSSRKALEDRVYARHKRGYEASDEVRTEIMKDHPTSLTFGMLWNSR